MFCRWNLSLIRGYGGVTKEAVIISFEEKHDEAEDLALNENNNGNLVPQELPQYEYHVSGCNIVSEKSETEQSNNPIYHQK